MKNQIFISICLIFLLFYSCGVDFSKNTVNETNISGKVTKKYVDYNNHGAMTIIYENSSEEFKYQIDEWVNNNLWNYLQIGDSVIKPSGTLILRVKKEDGSYKDYEYQR